MRIIKTFIALLFMQSAIQAQTVQDAKKAIESEFYFKAKKILIGLNATAPTVETNYYLGNVYSITGNIDSAKSITKKPANWLKIKTPSFMWLWVN